MTQQGEENKETATPGNWVAYFEERLIVHGDNVEAMQFKFVNFKVHF